jgi:hypothetical protein
MGMATSAQEFYGCLHSLTVRAAKLLLVGGCTATGGVGTLLCGSQGSSSFGPRLGSSFGSDLSNVRCEIEVIGRFLDR